VQEQRREQEHTLRWRKKTGINQCLERWHHCRPAIRRPAIMPSNGRGPWTRTTANPFWPDRLTQQYNQKRAGSSAIRTPHAVAVQHCTVAVRPQLYPLCLYYLCSIWIFIRTGVVADTKRKLADGQTNKADSEGRRFFLTDWNFHNLVVGIDMVRFCRELDLMSSCKYTEK
jgi:hypothetical protein